MPQTRDAKTGRFTSGGSGVAVKIHPGERNPRGFAKAHREAKQAAKQAASNRWRTK